MNVSAPRRGASIGVAAVSIICCGILALLSFLGNKAPQTVSDPAGHLLDGQPVAQVFRQGWGFFTRDAREDIVRTARLEAGRWVVKEGNLTSSSENLFGLSRKSRNFDQDLAVLLESLPADRPRTPCDKVSAPGACLAPSDFATAPSLRLHSSTKSLCGSVILIRQAPIPVSFARFEASPPGAVLPVEVECVHR
jgi:antimicrobial peptide system SdpA family protein